MDKRSNPRATSQDLLYDYMKIMTKLDQERPSLKHYHLILALRDYDASQTTTRVNNFIAGQVARYTEASKNIKCVTEITKLHDAYIHGRQE